MNFSGFGPNIHVQWLTDARLRRLRLWCLVALQLGLICCLVTLKTTAQTDVRACLAKS